MENKAVKIIVSVVIAVAILGVILFAVKNTDHEKITDPSNTAGTSTSEQTSENTTEPISEQNTEPTSEATGQTSEPTSAMTSPTSSGNAKKIDILVNYENFLPDDWEVDLVDLRNGEQIDRIAYDSLQKMMDDAREAGYNPLICSSYRSNEKQTRLFNNKVQQYIDQGYSEDQAKIEAGKWVAVPGTSEHQTGLTVDIVSVENQNLDNSQLNNPCQLWLMEHCYDYGFILRYPIDKSDITKINFEPWHYRYVGMEAAQEIKDKGICLEEYDQLHKNN